MITNRRPLFSFRISCTRQNGLSGLVRSHLNRKGSQGFRRRVHGYSKNADLWRCLLGRQRSLGIWPGVKTRSTCTDPSSATLVYR